MSIKWIPIRDWAFTQGEEFLVLVEGMYKPQKKICTAILCNTRIVTDYFDGDFSSNPPYTMVRPNGTHTITHAARLEYPKTLDDKVNVYLDSINVEVETKKDIIFHVLRIAKNHYEGKE